MNAQGRVEGEAEITKKLVVTIIHVTEICLPSFNDRQGVQDEVTCPIEDGYIMARIDRPDWHA